MLYSTPACVVKTIVPVGTAQVGCVVDATVGVAGRTQVKLTLLELFDKLK
jgi:hypothetical protein